MTLKELTQKAWKAVNHYQRLKIQELEVPAPYFMNIITPQILSALKETGLDEDKVKQALKEYGKKGSLFGWGLGKGSPAELEGA